MAEHRLTFHSGYRNARGKAYNSKHNQRENFQKSAKSGENIYFDYAETVCHGATFSENEKLFYNKYFTPHIKRHNDKARKNRQYGRLTTVAAYREKHPPEEIILSIGKKNGNSADLLAVYDDFRQWLITDCRRKDCGVLLLNAAMHVDETSFHIQMRQAYVYRDKDGDWQISQNKVLDRLGYQRPDMSKPVGRFNNAKMTFTASCREKLFEIAKSHGVELIREPLPKNEVGLPLHEYIAREKAREQARQEQAGYKKTIHSLEYDARLLTDRKERLNDDIERLNADIASKKEFYEKNYNDGVKLGYNAGLEKGYKEGYQEGVQNGANSSQGRLNAARRDLGHRYEENALNGADNEFGGGSPKG